MSLSALAARGYHVQVLQQPEGGVEIEVGWPLPDRHRLALRCDVHPVEFEQAADAARLIDLKADAIAQQLAPAIERHGGQP